MYAGKLWCSKVFAVFAYEQVKTRGAIPSSDSPEKEGDPGVTVRKIRISILPLCGSEHLTI